MIPIPRTVETPYSYIRSSILERNLWGGAVGEGEGEGRLGELGVEGGGGFVVGTCEFVGGVEGVLLALEFGRVVVGWSVFRVFLEEVCFVQPSLSFKHQCLL